MSMNPVLMFAVGIGAVILAISAVVSRRLYGIVPTSFRSKWLALTFLICCFFLGYSCYLIVLLAKIQFPVTALVSAIFLGGSFFVYGTLSLTHYTLNELKSLNDNLESEVNNRTRQLNSTNASLLESEKALARQNAFLDSVFNAISHPLYVIDAQTYKILLANDAADLDLDGPIQNCYCLTHGLDHPCGGDEHPCPIREVKETGKATVTEHIHINSKGEKRIVEVHGYPIFDETGRFSKIIEHCIDVTEKKEIHKEMLRAKKLAEDANTAKSRFLANMSHEIRTPMNAILGMTYLALETELDETQRNYIEKVYNSTEYLLGVIEDILDFSKMEAGQLKLDAAPFDLHDLVKGVVSTLGVLAKKKGLQLVTTLEENLPPVYIGDDMRMRQILLNLAGNAVKFTNEGSVTITVSHEPETTKDDKISLHFIVTDTGIGIRKDKLLSIFNSFEQTDTSFAREYGGTGLGLSICKQLITLMDGSIWVESEVNAGSSFHFIVRLHPTGKQPKEKVPQRENQPGEMVGGLHILIVDDNETNLEVARMMLTEKNQVTTARSGPEAMEIMATKDFDIIFMDVQMPGVDGLTTTTWIRALERGERLEVTLPKTFVRRLAHRLNGRHIPIIAMTAHALEDDKERCLAAGMDDHISKPFLYHHIVAVLQMAKPNQAPPPLPETTGDTRPLPASSDSITDYLKKTTKLSDQQVQQIKMNAMKYLTDYLADAQRALEDNDFPALSHQAHKIKGILLQCGLSDLAEKAQEMDIKARSYDVFPFNETLTAIQKSIERFSIRQ